MPVIATRWRRLPGEIARQATTAPFFASDGRQPRSERIAVSRAHRRAAPPRTRRREKLAAQLVVQLAQKPHQRSLLVFRQRIYLSHDHAVVGRHDVLPYLPTLRGQEHPIDASFG